MNGLKTKRLIWTIVFLGITLTAIVMEVVAGMFHPAGTIPWTEYLARYVPWPIQLVAYVALATWLPFHFWRHDHLRKAAYQRGREAGYVAGVAGGVDLARFANQVGQPIEKLMDPKLRAQVDAHRAGV